MPFSFEMSLPLARVYHEAKPCRYSFLRGHGTRAKVEQALGSFTYLCWKCSIVLEMFSILLKYVPFINNNQVYSPHHFVALFLVCLIPVVTFSCVGYQLWFRPFGSGACKLHPMVWPFQHHTILTSQKAYFEDPLAINYFDQLHHNIFCCEARNYLVHWDSLGIPSTKKYPFSHLFPTGVLYSVISMFLSPFSPARSHFMVIFLSLKQPSSSGGT